METSVLSGASPTTQQDKGDLMASWARTPLADRVQVHTWFEANRGAASLPASVESGAGVTREGVDTITPTTPSTGTLSSSGQRVSHQGRSTRAERVSSGTSFPELAQQGRLPGWTECRSDVPSSDPISEGDTSLPRNVSQSSKAASLVKGNANLYF